MQGYSHMPCDRRRAITWSLLIPHIFCIEIGRGCFESDEADQSAAIELREIGKEHLFNTNKTLQILPRDFYIGSFLFFFPHYSTVRVLYTRLIGSTTIH